MDRARPRVQSYRGTTPKFRLSEELTAGLKELSRRSGVTLFMTLLGAFQVLLEPLQWAARDSGRDTDSESEPERDRRVNRVFREHIGADGLDGNPIFREVMKRVKEVSLAAYAHQDIPFEKLGRVGAGAES